MEAIGMQSGIGTVRRANSAEAGGSDERATEAPAWDRLHLGEGVRDEDLHPDRRERLPRGNLWRDLAILTLAAMLAGAGIRAWLAPSSATPSAAAPSAAATAPSR
jgi:hypothetical protein